MQWGFADKQINYTYTQSGHIQEQQTTNKTRTHEYNAAERLTSVKDNNQSIATYQYDPQNRRISKTTGTAPNQTTTWFIYSAEGLLAELNQNAQQTKTYGWQPDSGWGTRLLWQAEHTQSPKTAAYHYIHNDHLGTPQIATDHTGKQTWAMISESFGDSTVLTSSTTEINIRFPGQYYDQETQMHYNFHRDYNPDLGRYMQSDPIGLIGGENFYAYVRAHVTGSIDPEGLKKKPEEAPFDPKDPPADPSLGEKGCLEGCLEGCGRFIDECKKRGTQSVWSTMGAYPCLTMDYECQKGCADNCKPNKSACYDVGSLINV